MTTETEKISWKDAGLPEEPGIYSSGQSIVPPNPPSRIAFLTTANKVFLAVGYRAHPILIWDALDLLLLGT